jgi:phosphoribosylformimino-5-aminoimidazole carboxamide ribotide isomerase
MNLYPAIDIKDGACVRLLYGDMDAVTSYNPDPGDQARQFAEAGCKWVHVVDLNGAVSGASVNREAVRAILEIGLPVQLGGGIRDMKAIEAWLNDGVARVILGTAALKNPDLVREAARAFPGTIAVGADARDGMIAAEGWVETSDIAVVELVQRFEDCGVAAVIFTDIGRDGALKGVNLEATAALARQTEIPVIASGGVASIDDIKHLAQDKSGIEGVITGRAIYDGRLDLAQALALLDAA